MRTELILVAIISGIGIALLFWGQHAARIRKQARFASRDPWSIETFKDAVLCDELTLADILFVLDALAKEVEVDRAMLRPEDRFSFELRPEAGWEFDDGLPLVGKSIESRFNAACGRFSVDKYQDIMHLVNDINAFVKHRKVMDNSVPS